MKDPEHSGHRDWDAASIVASTPTSRFLIAVFTVLAFGGGWGWGGLILLALARTNPTAAGRAMGIVQVGPMTGAVLGPLVFGALAEHVVFGVAWAAMALLALAGVVTILVSRRRLLGSQGAGPLIPARRGPRRVRGGAMG